ncbi:VpsD family glycosyltransferase [Psychromonas sp. Urea-02u-13]|uniref:VpsD family glycosyltransferase n=1 Tax=Psychromonas sp. Urea-02u-13 TaxID=2058326 RepID=UPI000C329E29|nr:VpsD family glycosyltransferase [Psychromonas sp. Urea-02u-13]PKG37526.1 glycosyl transferase family 1 [Psychromonas sp. Urea-02u-13]
MKKVLLVTPLSTIVWGSKNTGGVDSVCQMLVKGLQENPTNDFHYRVVAFDPTNSLTALNGVTTQLHNRLEVVQYNVSDIGAAKYFKLPGILHQRRSIKAQNKLFKPDIIHSHLISWLIAIGANVPTLATLHNYKKIGRTPRSKMNNFLYEKVVPSISKYFISSYTCVSGFLNESIKQDTHQSMAIVYNPIDSLFFQMMNKENDSLITLVTCALLTPKKGIHHIIEVLDLLIKQGNTAQLNIIGPATDVRYKEILQDLINQKGLQLHVAFLGAKVTTEIVALYAEADVGLFLSEEETFGLVPLEMLATGLPVIATETGIMADFQRNNIKILGLELAKQQDYQHITEQVMAFVEKKIVVDSEYIKANFSISAVIEAYENVYRKVLNNA